MGFITRLFRQVRALFRKEELNQELSEELAFHLEKQIEQNIAAGMSPKEARYAALRSFGGVEQVKEECQDAWGVRFIESLLQDLRFGVRMLAKNPGFTAVAVLTLALGIGANTAIFSVVNAVLLRPLPYHDPDQLYHVDEMNPKEDRGGVSPMDMEAFVHSVPAFEKMALLHWQNSTLTGPEGPENVFGALVSGDCFPMLGTQPSLGRTFREDEFRSGAPGVVILSDSLWQRRFGSNPHVLGKPMMMNGQAYSIIGVMPHDFFVRQWRLQFELWTPWQFTADVTNDREARFSAIARLKPGATPQQAQVQAEAVLRSIAPEDVRKGWHIRLESLDRTLTARVRPGLLVLLGGVGFVLLIACLNVANLLLARASERNKEVAVRMALGAGRTRIVRQMLAESLLLAGLGGLAGLLVAGWANSTLLMMFPERVDVPRLDQSHLDAMVLLFTLGLSLLTSFAFGLVPALQASRPNINEALKEGARSSSVGTRTHLLRNLLVIVETALSLVLLIGAGLMLRSFNRLLGVNPGFNPERVLTLHVPLPNIFTKNSDQAAYYTRMLESVQTIPGLNAVGLVVPRPLGDVDANWTFAMEGRPTPPGEQELVKMRVVSSGYFRAMGITVRRGRVFNDSDTAEAPGVAVINETLARRYFPNTDPLGRRVAMPDGGNNPKWVPIVGVVNDVKAISMRDESDPEIYWDFRQYIFAPFATTLTLRTVGDDPLRLAASVQKEIRSVNPDQPINDVKTMWQVVSDNVGQPRFYTVLLGAFAAVALILAVAGLYGVLSYAVSQRAHEIGIRMALGARPQDVLKMIVGQGLRLILIGVGAGILAALALTRVMASLLYGIRPTDPMTFVAVSIVLTGVALTACYIPARRAAKVDPMVAVRYE
jgi:putative ABC transport system permease protein